MSQLVIFDLYFEHIPEESLPIEGIVVCEAYEYVDYAENTWEAIIFTKDNPPQKVGMFFTKEFAIAFGQALILKTPTIKIFANTSEYSNAYFKNDLKPQDIVVYKENESTKEAWCRDFPWVVSVFNDKYDKARFCEKKDALRYAIAVNQDMMNAAKTEKVGG